MNPTQNNTATPRLLFLDDLRNPADCLHYMGDRKNVDVSIYQKEWHVVRTYVEFVSWIETNGLPDFISFDHDLADFDDDNMTEYSGMDCAKWLVEYCLDHKLTCPDFAIHSANPAGADNIAALLNNFKRMTERK